MDSTNNCNFCSIYREWIDLIKWCFLKYEIINKLSNNS